MKLFPTRFKLNRKSFFLAALILLAPVVSIAATNPTYNFNNLARSQFLQELKWFLTGTNGTEWDDHATDFMDAGRYQDEVVTFLGGQRREIFEDVFKTASDSADGPGPDIMELRKQMRTRTANAGLPGDAIASNQSNTTEHAVREAGRLGTLIRIDSLMGKTNGVGAYKEVYDQVAEQLEDTRTELRNGYNDNITQDIMKKVLAVQGIQTKVLTESRLEHLRARIDSQYTNLNLVDIGRILEESNRSQKVENRANTDFLLRSSTAAIR
jgi:hypothetical protein